MKKIILSIVLTVFSFTSASAEIGVNVGASGQVGVFIATAKDDDRNAAGALVKTQKTTDYMSAGYGSLFIEKTLGDKFAIGIDYVPQSLETETTEVSRTTEGELQAQTQHENKIQVDFEDLTTFYAAFNVNENLYIKGGVASVDVITNENLGTGGSYANTNLDATMFGFGYNKNMDNGVFFRLEANYMDFDGASLSSGDHVISLTSLHGLNGKLSIGRSF
jgi:hypothetical protein